jgi:transaldolase
VKLFIDSADIDEIERAYASGIIDGVTTNPSLLKQALALHKKGSKKINLEEYLIDILTVAKNTPVSLEVTKTDFEGMVKEGAALYNRFNPIANNVVIKIPINTSLTGKTKTTDGLRAIKALAQARIPVNCTLVFTPEQALMAAKAGATYVSIFAGRIDDYIRSQHGIGFEKPDYYPAEGYVHAGKHLQDNGILSGVDVVKQTVALFKQFNMKAQVLAASVRNTRQLRECAAVGSHVATVPPEILNNALNHVKTMEGVKQFSDDAPADYARLANDKK